MQPTDAKNRFGELLEEAMTEPVLIQRNGRDVALVMSKAEFDLRHAITARREQVQRYHEESIERFGGAPGVRDAGLIDAALARPSPAANRTPSATGHRCDRHSACTRSRSSRAGSRSRSTPAARRVCGENPPR